MDAFPAWKETAVEIGRYLVLGTMHVSMKTAATLDAWGRPLPGHWNSRRIDIPNEEANLLLAADPAAQASRTVEVMLSEADRFAVSDTAIGVPDRATVPFLIDHLASCGVPAFDPQERPLREHPLCELIARLLDLRRSAPYRTVADLLRQAGNAPPNGVIHVQRQKCPCAHAAPRGERVAPIKIPCGREVRSGGRQFRPG